LAVGCVRAGTALGYRDDVVCLGAWVHPALTAYRVPLEDDGAEEILLMSADLSVTQ
jgi:hypothetical protein